MIDLSVTGGTAGGDPKYVADPRPWLRTAGEVGTGGCERQERSMAEIGTLQSEGFSRMGSTVEKDHANAGHIYLVGDLSHLEYQAMQKHGD